MHNAPLRFEFNENTKEFKVAIMTSKQIATRLNAFRIKEGLSFRKLSSICGGATVGLSKSTIERICNDTLNPKHMTNVVTNLSNALRIYLLNTGRTSLDEITDELTAIFGHKESLSMITARVTLPFEAQQYFKLNADPFAPRHDPRSRAEAFTTPQLDRLAAHAEDTINYQGFTAVIGEIGSGKTLLKARVLETVRASGGKMHLIFPSLVGLSQSATEAG